MQSRHSADLEVGDTAGLETCATTPAAAAQSWVCNIRFSACELEAFEPEEIRLLYRASFRAVLCNIAINGLGGCGGLIRPKLEPNRVRLEQDFMAFRDKFFACTGWQGLLSLQRERIDQRFLTVAVAKENLAW